MQNEIASAARSEPHTESIGSLADLVVEEIAAAAGQAERERDLLLGKQLAEHALRLMQLETAVRNRLAELRDGEKGVPGEKGEKGDQGEKGEAGQAGQAGAKGDQGDPGAPGEAVTGPAGRDGIDGKDGAPGERGERGLPGQPGVDGRTLFNIRDTYDAAEKYLIGDVVTLNASWFVARKDEPGPCPGPDWKAGPSGRKGEPGPRGQRGDPGVVIAAWDIDRKRFIATPVLSDGSNGPPLNLRLLFEQFHAEAG
jgi:Collagen triple helix repeat (20 copies)